MFFWSHCFQGGEALAHFNYGTVLEAGQGVGKDLEKAAEEYLQAGDKVRVDKETEEEEEVEMRGKDKKLRQMNPNHSPCLLFKFFVRGIFLS